jgi:hypothetical protein
MLCALTVRLTFHLKQTHNLLLERIIKGVELVVQNCIQQKVGATRQINLLSAKQSIRSLVYSGTHYFLTILPHPTVRIHKYHACCLPSECIADIRAHGLCSVFYQPGSSPCVEYPIRGQLETNFMHNLFPKEECLLIAIDGKQCHVRLRYAVPSTSSLMMP